MISIHKKGDPMDMDNYRGISLMSVPLKLLLIILTYRLARTLERKGLLAREQAGFRAKEECSGQVAALVETVMRRSGAGQVTYAMFVDLTKAYDMVPHEALFAKMDQIGIRGSANIILITPRCPTKRPCHAIPYRASAPLSRDDRRDKSLTISRLSLAILCKNLATSRAPQ